MSEITGVADAADEIKWQAMFFVDALFIAAHQLELVLVRMDARHAEHELFWPAPLEERVGIVSRAHEQQRIVRLAGAVRQYAFEEIVRQVFARVRVGQAEGR